MTFLQRTSSLPATVVHHTGTMVRFTSGQLAPRRGWTGSDRSSGRNHEPKIRRHPRIRTWQVVTLFSGSKAGFPWVRTTPL